MKNKWLPWVGFALNLAVVALMLMAGSGKALGNPPPEILENMTKHGLRDQIQLIGIGEVASAILLILPWTSPLGTLLTSGFWGGAICLHMSHGEPYSFQSMLLLLTWAGALLRGSVPLFRSCTIGCRMKAPEGVPALSH